MIKCIYKTMMLLVGLAFTLNIMAQEPFSKKLQFLINRQAKTVLKEAETTKVSDVIFIEYDHSKRKISVIGDSNSVFFTVTKLMANEKETISYILDSAKNSFIQPIFYLVDQTVANWDSKNLIVSLESVVQYLNLLKKINYRTDVFDKVLFITGYPSITSRD